MFSEITCAVSSAPFKPASFKKPYRRGKIVLVCKAQRRIACKPYLVGNRINIRRVFSAFSVYIKLNFKTSVRFAAQISWYTMTSVFKALSAVSISSKDFPGAKTFIANSPPE